MSIVTCRSHLARNSSKPVGGRSTEVQISYLGGMSGPWQVTKMETHSGESLRPVSRIQVQSGLIDRAPVGTAWILNGVVSSSRYVAREERDPFDATVTSFSRGEATCAALIPIRKSLDWWNLGRFDRTQIVEARSRVVNRVMRFLPAFARRLRQGHGLSEEFDSVTWFEFSPSDMTVFDDMLGALRSSEEWQFVEREIEVRLEIA